MTFLRALLSLVLFVATGAATGGAQASPPASGLPVAQITAMNLTPFEDRPAAPNFHLNDLKGETIALSSLKGKVVLLNFWATWCPPCRVEMPSMEALDKAFRSDPNVVILAVSSRETLATVRDFLNSNPYHFRVLLDTAGVATELYGISAIPTTFLIDRQGRIVAGRRGQIDWGTPEFAAGLKAVLAL